MTDGSTQLPLISIQNTKVVEDAINKHELPDSVINVNIHKIVLSKPIVQTKQASGGTKSPHSSDACAGNTQRMSTAFIDTNREYIRAIIERNGDMFQISMYTAKQVFHNNFAKAQLKPILGGLFGVKFLQYHAWDGQYEYMAGLSKKGKILTSRKKSVNQPSKTEFINESFDRQKRHILRQGESIPALVDMGVFTKDNKVAKAMHDKFGQINRFLELLADETGPDAWPSSSRSERPGPDAWSSAEPECMTINIIDFGCGKSYLTFLVYHYFTVVRRLKVNMCGMDLDAHVVKNCTATAEKYGYTSLKFLQGDIGQQDAPPLEEWGSDNTFNIVISLHACDTATDYALYNAIKWDADLIYAAPCCQHELRGQMKPKYFSLFSNYGIIKERFASIATDAIRANLLECCGYKAQIIEFIDIEHTAKNLLIRAKRQGGKNKNHTSNLLDKNRSTHSIFSKDINPVAWKEVAAVIAEFGFEPMLLKLLSK